MKVYTVIPISRGINQETLTYFGPDTVPLGSLVSIPLRKKSQYAIVIDEAPIPENKSEIKSSTFTLKKIGKVVNEHFLPKAFFDAASRTAHYYGAPTGSILQNMIPSFVLEHGAKIPSVIQIKTTSTKPEVLVIQDTDQERFAQYKGFIRGEFAKHSSVFFCLPTLEDIRQAKKTLEKGIEKYTCILHSGLSKKELLEAIELISNETHPILIIGTPPFLSIARKGLGSIVLDRENSRSYRTLTRPYIDIRVFVKYFAEHSGIKLLLGDLMLSIDTLWRQKNDEYIELFPLKFRTLTSAECLKVDMKLPKGKFEEGFRVLSRELEALIDKTTEDNERLFIFSARKGLAPTTVCGDCGQVVTCKQCGAPITLYKRKDENIFMCNHCGEKRDTLERCTHCDSWKLQTLGIGAELIEEEIRKRFPNSTVFRIDKDVVKTDKQARTIMRKFEETPGSILVGTEMALLYMEESIENIAVGSIDSLFSLPDFRINEKILYILLTLRTRAQKVFIIQTRNGNEKILDYALKGNVVDFYRDEIEERKKFSYPPYSTFVKLTIEGKRNIVEPEFDSVTEYLQEFEPAPFESANLSARGNVVLNILFRFKATDWPHKDFLKKIITLPRHIMVKVDPESLL